MDPSALFQDLLKQGPLVALAGFWMWTFYNNWKSCLAEQREELRKVIEVIEEANTTRREQAAAFALLAEAVKELSPLVRSISESRDQILEALRASDPAYPPRLLPPPRRKGVPE